MNLEKLPKWAQEHIRGLEQQKATAIKALNEYHDSVSESPFYSTEMLCIGEKDRSPSIKRRYFQAYSMTVEHDGIELLINLRDGIDISWSGRDVGIFPNASNSITVKNTETPNE